MSFLVPFGPSGAKMARQAAEVFGELPARYRLMGYVGAGAFATVWRAYDQAGLRSVALKRFHAVSGPRRGDYYKELGALAQLQHENIVQLYDLFDTPGGRPYLVLEYCPEGALRRALNGKPWPLPRAQEMGLAIARGLEAAHRAGLTHRDLKPDNVLLNGTGAKVADFGLARGGRPRDTDGVLTGLTGSPAYMAPEQFQGEWGSASDVYALGVTLYEMLCGRPPFEGGPRELARQHLLEPVPLDLPVPSAWRDLLGRLLAKSPQDRPTATEIVIRLSPREKRFMSSPEREQALQRDLQTLRSTMRGLADFEEVVGGEAESPAPSPVVISPSELLERSREQLSRLATDARRSRRADEEPIDIVPNHPSSESFFGEESWGENLSDDGPLLPSVETATAESDNRAESIAPEPEGKVEDAFSNFNW